MKFVDVCLTHQELENSYCKNKIVVIIDVLRASSTINTLLYNKVKFVKPIEKLEECKKLKNHGYIIMAERLGKKVDGFDFGNSPTKINSKEFDGKIKVFKLNTDENPNVASQYGIRSIPTLMVFKGGQKVDTVVGAVPKATLSGTISKYL